jgi:hypothetical protein
MEGFEGCKRGSVATIISVGKGKLLQVSLSQFSVSQASFEIVDLFKPNSSQDE